MLLPIFLDIEGVVVPIAPTGTGRGDLDGFCLANLKTIFDMFPGAQIILTSTWRLDSAKQERLNTALSELGLPPVAGGTCAQAKTKTAVTYLQDNPEEQRLVGNRVDEICEWLEEHGPCAQWVAIDGMDLGVDLRMEGHFARTDMESGLSGSDADRAISLLHASAPKAGNAASVCVADKGEQEEVAHVAKGQRSRGRRQQTKAEADTSCPSEAAESQSTEAASVCTIGTAADTSCPSEAAESQSTEAASVCTIGTADKPLAEVSESSAVVGCGVTIFLDIEGVVVPIAPTGTGGGDLDGFCLANLKTIFDTFPGAQIILTSTWRLDSAKQECLNTALSELGLPPVAGGTCAQAKTKTAVTYLQDDPEEQRLVGNRVDEICKWLEEHGPCAQWVAIDGMDLGVDLRMEGHFARTDMESGLSGSDADRAISLLHASAPKAGNAASVCVADKGEQEEVAHVAKGQRSRGRRQQTKAEVDTSCPSEAAESQSTEAASVCTIGTADKPLAEVSESSAVVGCGVTIFLDIEGVVVPIAPTGTGGGDLDGFCLANLKTIFDTFPGAQIILTSTWRLDSAKQDCLNTALSELGLPPVAGGTCAQAKTKTAVTYLQDDPEEQRLVGNRVDEICEWLEEHGPCAQWVAIDGMDLGVDLRMEGHFVRTDMESGLSGSDADRVLSLLNALHPSPKTYLDAAMSTKTYSGTDSTHSHPAHPRKGRAARPNTVSALQPTRNAQQPSWSAVDPVALAIFLGIEGVLLPMATMADASTDLDGFCLANLKTIFDTFPGAQIILTSTWRWDAVKLVLLNHALSELGLPPVAGGTCAQAKTKTAVTYLQDNPEEQRLVGNRVDEICEWLEEHGPCAQWVAIDGMDLGVDLRMEGHFVRTDMESGLSGSDADRAISLLHASAPKAGYSNSVGVSTAAAEREAEVVLHEAKGQRSRARRRPPKPESLETSSTADASPGHSLPSLVCHWLCVS